MYSFIWFLIDSIIRTLFMVLLDNFSLFIPFNNVSLKRIFPRLTNNTSVTPSFFFIPCVLYILKPYIKSTGKYNYLSFPNKRVIYLDLITQLQGIVCGFNYILTHKYVFTNLRNPLLFQFINILKSPDLS